jgi:hypothetical protein
MFRGLHYEPELEKIKPPNPKLIYVVDAERMERSESYQELVRSSCSPPPPVAAALIGSDGRASAGVQGAARGAGRRQGPLRIRSRRRPPSPEHDEQGQRHQAPQGTFITWRCLQT